MSDCACLIDLTGIYPVCRTAHGVIYNSSHNEQQKITVSRRVCVDLNCKNLTIGTPYL
jgi:hypothetical protein